MLSNVYNVMQSNVMLSLTNLYLTVFHKGFIIPTVYEIYCIWIMHTDDAKGKK